MKAALLKSGSNPVQTMTRTPSGSFSSSQNGPVPSSVRVSFQSSKSSGFSGLKRSSSDTDMMRSEHSFTHLGRIGSVSFPDMGIIVEEESGEGINFGNGKGNQNFGNGGKGGNYNHSNNMNDNEKRKLDKYYLEMLKSNPRDSLLLRNYAKYLHEVEKNGEKAEEYYGRAILASPGDGELLSLYGNLIWETQRDENRAQSYFDQAVLASPHDSMILGSYANFLWESEEDEEEENGEEMKQVAPTVVGAY